MINCVRTMAIDWEAIAKQIGGLAFDGSELVVGTEGGMRALEILIGEENLRNSVDHFISQKPGAFTVEMVLKIIRSRIVMDRCFEIYITEPGTGRAGSAVFLLGCMADERALPWVRRFLEDSDKWVRLNGLRVLQNILYGPLDDEDLATAKELLERTGADPDPLVQERALSMRQHFTGD